MVCSKSRVISGPREKMPFQGLRCVITKPGKVQGKEAPLEGTGGEKHACGEWDQQKDPVLCVIGFHSAPRLAVKPEDASDK